jgi:hypothetical protein
MSSIMTALSSTVTEIIRTNRPSRKPQLWEDPGSYLRRRVKYTTAMLRDKGWLDRPCVVPLRVKDLVIEVVPRGCIGRTLFLYGLWEIVGTRVIELLLRPGMRFIDIGANMGYTRPA